MPRTGDLRPPPAHSVIAEHDCERIHLKPVEHEENTIDWNYLSSCQGYQVYRCDVCLIYWGCRYQYDAGTGYDDRWQPFGLDVTQVKRHY